MTDNIFDFDQLLLLKLVKPIRVLEFCLNLLNNQDLPSISLARGRTDLSWPKISTLNSSPKNMFELEVIPFHFMYRKGTVKIFCLKSKKSYLTHFDKNYTPFWNKWRKFFYAACNPTAWQKLPFFLSPIFLSRAYTNLNIPHHTSFSSLFSQDASL